MIQQFMSRQFFTFLVTGGIAAVINFSSRLLYSHWLSFSSAVVLAYVTGMITAFFLAKLFVFKSSRQAVYHSALIFVVVNLVAVLQTWLISMVLAYYIFPWLNITWHTKELAHAIGIGVPVFTSYIGHKKWSFR